MGPLRVVEGMKHLAVLLAPVALTACQVAAPDPATTAPPPPQQAPGGEAAVQGAMALLPVLDAEVGAAENLFYSPASIEQAFGVLELGAAGETRSQLRSVLPPPRDAKGLAGKGDGVEVRLANALWLSDKWRFNPQFVAQAADRYGATAEALDFSQQDASAARINAWADGATQGLIPKVVGPDAIDPDGAAFITNALYFDGLWQTPFDGREQAPFLFGNGQNRPFTLMRETITAPLVKRGEWSAVRLAYQNPRYAMDVIMPTDRVVMRRAPAVDEISAIASDLGKAAPSRVLMRLPQFEVDYDAGLVPPLQAIGLTLPFDAAAADLSGIAQPGQRRVVVDAVRHIAKLQVFDIGTRAAAVTVMRIVPTAARIEPTAPVPFTADRPFVVVIRDLERGEVLFVGRIADPQPFEPAEG